MAPDHVHHAPDGAHHDLRVLQSHGLLADRRAPEHRDHLHPPGLAVGAQRLCHLDAELARWREHERLDVRVLGIRILDHRQAEGGGLAGARLGLADHVAALQERRDRLLLDRGRTLVAEVRERLEHRRREAEVGKGRHPDG